MLDASGSVHVQHLLVSSVLQMNSSQMSLDSSRVSRSVVTVRTLQVFDAKVLRLDMDHQVLLGAKVAATLSASDAGLLLVRRGPEKENRQQSMQKSYTCA